ncbi:hypothetical protein BDF14DRAFT_1308208 [Spinellus fusiger]|nr:hypothetical protein BDF14DRAFT_1308208 [Spinellus fusiger]
MSSFFLLALVNSILFIETMEMNICLYCEKRLENDAMSFCSDACQASEAKSGFNGYSNEYTYSSPWPPIHAPAYSKRFLPPLQNHLSHHSYRTEPSTASSSFSTCSITESEFSVDDEYHKRLATMTPSFEMVCPSYLPCHSLSSVENVLFA